MRYCTRCILPDTRPGIVLDADGVCSGCRGHVLKTEGIDWDERRLEWEALVARARDRSTGYDCVVPVSGGKDSWYQVIRCQEHGLKVLAVTWRTPGRTAIGQQNIDAMISELGVDHVDYSIATDVEARFMRAAYERKGATGIPMHLALFAIPIRMASQLQIPLVVWGENPQLEFGGAAEDQLSTRLDREWVRRFGVNNQTTVEDWIGWEGLTATDLVAYQLPDEAAFTYAPESVFLGAYFRWDSYENAAIAESRGFRHLDEARAGVWTFADIDCDFISLHHFLKWFKFGMTRAFDNLSVEIRYGRITRDDAIDILRSVGPQVPVNDIKRFCQFVDRDEEWFWEVAERFRNHDIWTFDDGRWTIPGFLIDDWSW